VERGRQVHDVDLLPQLVHVEEGHQGLCVVHVAIHQPPAARRCILCVALHLFLLFIVAVLFMVIVFDVVRDIALEINVAIVLLEDEAIELHPALGGQERARDSSSSSWGIGTKLEQVGRCDALEERRRVRPAQGDQRARGEGKTHELLQDERRR